MSANRAKNTQPELKLRQALREQNIIGYRLHRKNISGRPDISFGPQKIAIFVNGCFWHQCLKCKFPLPSSNRKFWRDKFTRNKIRDNLKVKRLRALGWRTLVFWECEINKDLKKLVNKVQALF